MWTFTNTRLCNSLLWISQTVANFHGHIHAHPASQNQKVMTNLILET